MTIVEHRAACRYLTGAVSCCAGSLPRGLPASPDGARSQLTTSTVAPMANAQRKNFIQRRGRFAALRSSCVLMGTEHSLDAAAGCRTLSRRVEAEGLSALQTSTSTSTVPGVLPPGPTAPKKARAKAGRKVGLIPTRRKRILEALHHHARGTRNRSPRPECDGPSQRLHWRHRVLPVPTGGTGHFIDGTR